MRSGIVVVVLVLAIVGLPPDASAQEQVLSGTVTDTSGAVLPGVVATAVHTATGNTFAAVTDAQGAYRIPVRTGLFELTVELPGFTTVTRSGLELLVGQSVIVNFQMAISTVQETVTVTGESPLVDVTTSRVSGVVDSNQMSELPVNGRNWMDLTMLAPGSRANAVGDTPIPRGRRGDYQLNVDGQQVTAMNSPRSEFQISRDAIGEIELVANRFDASQGRSTGMQVNAITRSGTNTFAVMSSGYFRHDSLNAKDFIADRVLPYSNQQFSNTVGGPILRDRIHFFAAYEFEREPRTIIFNSPFPRFNVDLTGSRTVHKFFSRGDVQVSPQTRFSARWSRWDQPPFYDFSSAGGAEIHPSGAINFERGADQVNGSFLKVLSNRAVNELKVGYVSTYFGETTDINQPGLPPTPGIEGNRLMTIQLQGYDIGGQSVPAFIGAENFSIRDDFSFSFSKGGRHNLKAGGEIIHGWFLYTSCATCAGVLDAQGGPIPDNIEDLFPVWNDPTTWNIGALSPISRFYSILVGPLRQDFSRDEFAVWLQDDWNVTSRLTVNLGLRYDLPHNYWVNDVEIPPFLTGKRPDDTDNISPRLGMAFSLTPQTVVRGGVGKYFGASGATGASHTIQGNEAVEIQVLNDGRPDFAVNPFNGPIPTFEQAVETGLERSLIDPIYAPKMELPESIQASLGLQQQLGDRMSLSADYVYQHGKNEGGFGVFNRNINLSYNPATGVNYPFTDVGRRPYPDWGAVIMESRHTESFFHGLEMALTKRYSDRWQASATYLLSRLEDREPAAQSGLGFVTFPTPDDLGGARSLAVSDQRHRAVFNGIWDLGYGLQLSGLYFYGSGQRFARTYGGDLRRMGAGSTNRLRPDGTIVPRNDFVGRPLHRVDTRVTKAIALGDRANVDLFFEVFNLFNHENYGSYVTNEANRAFGRPTTNINVAYQPRMGQVGFRLTF